VLINFVILTKTHRRTGYRHPSLFQLDRPEAGTRAQAGPVDRTGTGQGTGSARDTWFSAPSKRKSLIVEKSAAMGRPSFAMNPCRFAMSPVSGHRRVACLSLLSRLLKEKKKEGVERKESGDSGPPRVGPGLPSIREGACFLGHVSHESASGDWWQLMAAHSFEISHLAQDRRRPTCPRVALRMVPLRTQPEGGR
jgi:hypothetical protein